jgi:ribonuclease R
VQAASDGRPDDDTEPLLEAVIKPLYGVFHALHRARVGRGTIDLDLPEREILLDEKGQVAAIRPARRLDSHRLIEELMITANVAAAETLEALRAPVMYRVHDRPSAEKIVDLRTFLKGLGHQLAGGVGVQPGHFSKLLAEVATLPHAHAVNTAILRSQSQAAYSPHNLGHFGLSLRKYSHFTSPIRRYADLLVHRALIAGLGLGPGGLEKGAGDRFEAIGEHLSKTERRASGAERDAVDRFTTAYMADRVGAEFPGRISGVARFGAFVSLDDSGAEGLIPRSSLPGDLEHDEAGQRLIGNRLSLRLGDAVEVRLKEAEIATASLVFELVSGGSEVKGRAGGTKRKPAKKPRTARRGRGRRR